MWVRLRLDITWRDLALGLVYCLLPGRRSRALSLAERAWSVDDPPLVTLSVRSGFDLALRALRLPHGSEVMFTALNVPDMVEIVRVHGLVPVPVDIDPQGHVCADSLRRSLSPSSRMLVVSHLFGGRAPMDRVFDVLQGRDITVVEDVAQGFRRVGDHGHPSSDVVLHSFGPIKTATALGGAVLRVASADHARICLRFSLLKLLSSRAFSWAAYRGLRLAGCDVDALVNASARAFPREDGLRQFRVQPSTPLLRLLRRRWRTYEFGRLTRRDRRGRRLDAVIGQGRPASHGYWVYPMVVQDPQGECGRFQAAGFDATRYSRLTLVSTPDESKAPRQASGFWPRTVFLPWYPEMSDHAFERLSNLASESVLVPEDRRRLG